MLLQGQQGVSCSDTKALVQSIAPSSPLLQSPASTSPSAGGPPPPTARQREEEKEQGLRGWTALAPLVQTGQPPIYREGGRSREVRASANLRPSLSSSQPEPWLLCSALPADSPISVPDLGSGRLPLASRALPGSSEWGFRPAVPSTPPKPQPWTALHRHRRNVSFVQEQVTAFRPHYILS